MKNWLVGFLVLVVSVSGALLMILAFLLITWILSEPPFFADYDNAQEVRDVILGEYTLNQTTLADVQSAIDTKQFGGLYCYTAQTYPTYPLDPNSDELELGMICEAIARKALIFPGFYRIIFFYDNDVLTDVEVTLEYK